MKHIIHIIVLAVITVVYISCEKEDYALQRLSAPAQLTASRGDTSVFLKWTKVEDASFYTLVRGLKVIADSLTVESYEDDSAPDTFMLWTTKDGVRLLTRWIRVIWESLMALNLVFLPS